MTQGAVPTTDPHVLASEIKQFARRQGFDLVGIAPATPSAYRQYLRDWLDQGQHGTMKWLADRFDQRTDPAGYFTGAASVICVAVNYHVQLESSPANGTPGRVARYALGDDYHELLKGRLYQLADWLRERAGGQTRCAVDTAPVMEKELAARAGLGWVGKNTCLIHPQAGSWLLLGEVLTTLVLPFDPPGIDHCGTCQRCIEACPTGAITAPYQLDARRCISYLTIEHRNAIEGELQNKIGDWLYGCDICQDVCPFNVRARVSIDPALKPRFASGTLDAAEVLAWGEEDYRQHLRGSAMKRVKLPILKRNAAFVLENAAGESRGGG